MKKHFTMAGMLITLLLIAGIITSVAVIYYRILLNRGLTGDNAAITYNNHYAFVADQNDSFYQAVYEYASRAAIDNGDYLEFLGTNLDKDYSEEDLMKMAIAAKMDGIILENSGSQEMHDLIIQASAAGIPVVTIGTDDTSSTRISYIGASYYDLGIRYGQEILRHVSQEHEQILIIMRPDAEASSQGIIYAGINDIISSAGDKVDYSINTAIVDDSSAFEAEEYIGNLIRSDQTPENLVCLTELDTTCAIQALVEYNKVGRTKVFGFFVNDEIYSAIDKDILCCTVSIDTAQMGRFCMGVLRSYADGGLVSEYMPVDVRVIDADNVDDYIGKDTQEPEEIQ